MKTTLFFTRLALYLLAIAAPVVHPAIPVAYDAAGWAVWFVLLPAEMIIAYWLAPPRYSVRTWLSAGAALLGAVLLFVFFKTGLSIYLLTAAGVGVGAFLLTALIFRLGMADGRVASLCAIEQFLLALVYYRLLSFTRSGEEAAHAAGGLAQALFVVIIVAFLVHGIVIYLSVFGAHRPGGAAVHIPGAPGLRAQRRGLQQTQPQAGAQHRAPGRERLRPGGRESESPSQPGS